VLPEEYEPTIEESYVKSVELSGKPAKSGESAPRLEVEILDTAGKEEYTALRDLYIKSGDAFMLVYGVDSLSSFHELSQIYQRIQRVKGEDVVSSIKKYGRQII